MLRTLRSAPLRQLLATALALALAFACITVASDGQARPTRSQRSAARDHANKGRDLFNQEKYAESIEQFRAAQELVQAPPHLLYIARALVKIGKLIEARQAYQQVIDEQLKTDAPEAFAKAQESARDELAELDAKIPKIAVTVDGPTPDATRITVDGVQIDASTLDEPLPLDPGEHKVVAEADGYETETKSFELAEGAGTVEIELVLAESGVADPVEPGDGDDTESEISISYPPFILMGAGVLVVGVGAVTGGLALGKAGELKDACPQNPCPTENESLADDANMLATISTVSFIVGGVAAGAGVAWLIWDLTAGGETADDGGDAVGLQIRPYLGPGAMGVQGTF